METLSNIFLLATHDILSDLMEYLPSVIIIPYTLTTVNLYYRTVVLYNHNL